MKFTEALGSVMCEYTVATDTFKKFNSAHEGYSVLAEEVDELWQEVKKNPTKHPQRKDLMRKEAIQVAAMALRFLEDCC